MERRDAENMTKRIAKLVVEGESRRGRPKKSWKELVKDLRKRNLDVSLTFDRSEWRRRYQQTVDPGELGNSRASQEANG